MTLTELKSAVSELDAIASGEGYHATVFLPGCTLEGAIFEPTGGTLAMDAWKINSGETFKESRRVLIDAASINAIMMAE